MVKSVDLKSTGDYTGNSTSVAMDVANWIQVNSDDSISCEFPSIFDRISEGPQALTSPSHNNVLQQNMPLQQYKQPFL